MDSIDISKWTGGPPAAASPKDSNAHSDSEDGSVSERGGSATFGSQPDLDGSQGDVVPTRDANYSPLARDQASTLGSSQASATDLKGNNGIFIEVPALPDGSTWERLPGYYTVTKVLRELGPDQYVVKLASGEVETVRPLFSSSSSHRYLRWFYPIT